MTSTTQQPTDDIRLSYRDLGLLVYLRTLPEGTPITADALAGPAHREGRDAVRASLRALEITGYITTRRAQDPQTGRWATRKQLVHPATAFQASETCIAEFPQVQPKTGNPTTENQASGHTPEGYPHQNAVTPQVEPKTGNPTTVFQALKDSTTHLDLPTYVPAQQERAHEHNDNIPTGPGTTGPRSGQAHRLVGKVIGPEFPADTRTALAREAATLLGQYEPALIATALETWRTKTGIGPRVLPSLVADLIKTTNSTNERSERVRSGVPGARHEGSTGSKRVDKALGFMAQVERVKAELAAEQSRKLLEGGVSA
ncbi:hypothetical protein [Kibdelosporangium phytohabitans]|uniref:Helix-turn-helix domain-containing protein n=1 Tax=Kibdelosporangium phytohabitans TaxID=860235 RepID=A0A0N9HVS9_9PSEU|nr:hypothetical protein [Kibdelosporangium phytohabitans]ALG07637.1 hypothetical protein AOZ06_12620 [Kibdelosporangium phytohabitans]ALG07693.1 hypothetical protein AOZ06_12940 [Kibdelosporangium phytohabitans]MBE1471409.1 hypothetical protein [Kibdelosporangium phytohabitans]